MKVHMPAPDLIRRNLACSLAAECHQDRQTKALAAVYAFYTNHGSTAGSKPCLVHWGCYPLAPPTLLSPFNQTSGTVSQFNTVLKSPSPQISDSWVLKYTQCAVNHSSQLEASELLSSASQPPTLETAVRCFSAALPGGDTRRVPGRWALPPHLTDLFCRFAKAQVQARLLLPLYPSPAAPSSLLENLCKSRGSHLKCEAGGRGTCCARAVMPRRLTVKNHWSKQQLPEHPEPGGTRWLMAPCCSTAPQLAAAPSCATSGVLCQREGHAAALLPGEHG